MKRWDAGARDCGRPAEDVALIAVSKTFSADEVWPTIAVGGQTVFGENRVQEAAAKWRDLRGRASGLAKSIELHLIGPLQSNKAREAGRRRSSVIETIDREKIAAALAAEIARRRQDASTVRRGQHGRRTAKSRNSSRGTRIVSWSSAARPIRSGSTD